MTMRSFELAWGVAALGMVLAFGCSGDDEAPPAGFGQGSGGDSGSDSGGTRPRGGRGGKGGGASGEAGTESSGGVGGESGRGHAGEPDGRSGQGGQGADGGTGNRAANGGGGNELASGGALIDGPDLDCPKLTSGGESTAPVCDPRATWSDGQIVLSDPVGGESVLAVSFDELTLVWHQSDALSQAALVADRAATDEDFGTASELVDSMGQYASEATITPDRLRIGASVGGLLVEFFRSTTADPFVYGGPGYFELIDQDAGARALMLSDPVIGSDNRTLYYAGTASFAEGVTLYLSTRETIGNWPVGTPVEECEFLSQTTGGRRPRALSADMRTLFYYDEPRALTRAAWRSSPDDPFDTFVDLAAYPDAHPNAACDNLYYTAPAETGVTLQVSAEK